MFARVSIVVATLILFSDCGGDDRPIDNRYESRGPYGVGNQTFIVTDATRGRELVLEVWFPREATSEASEPTQNFVVDVAERATYEGLLAEADPSCPSKTTRSLRDALASGDSPLPLLVFSHCHNCVRFSSFAIAEHLASHGFVVAAPDHASNTLFDDLAGVGASLDSDFLRVRAADISFVIDSMLAGESGIAIDPERIGVYGHSFGAVTTGLVLQEDPRPIAGFAIASPMENPLLTGVEMDMITDPVGFLVAVEDNSISELGNIFIRQNFEEARAPAWKGEVADAGHWSFSDICGVHSQFEACCGMDTRQTDGEPFEYLQVSTGISIAQTYVTAFFAAHVLGDDNARRYLSVDRFPEELEIEEHSGG